MNYGIEILQYLFPEIIFNNSDEYIHLTFDDGPHPKGTESILKILRERKIPATFFVLGENALKYPELLTKIKSEGHQIGNHSFTHSNLFFKNKDSIKKSIMNTEEVINSVTNERTIFFRPPYGYFNISMLKIWKIWKVNA